MNTNTYPHCSPRCRLKVLSRHSHRRRRHPRGLLGNQAAGIAAAAVALLGGCPEAAVAGGARAAGQSPGGTPQPDSLTMILTSQEGLVHRQEAAHHLEEVRFPEGARRYVGPAMLSLAEASRLDLKAGGAHLMRNQPPALLGASAESSTATVLHPSQTWSARPGSTVRVPPQPTGIRRRAGPQACREE